MSKIWKQLAWDWVLEQTLVTKKTYDDEVLGLYVDTDDFNSLNSEEDQSQPHLQDHITHRIERLDRY